MSAESVETGLAPQIYPRVGWAADTDEVAAILESTGINDRVAHRDYGHHNVFTLARQVRLAIGRPGPADPVPVSLPVLNALVRAGLYLTPAVVAVGMAPLVGDLAWYATTGLLVAGWGASQGLAYLGYHAANEAGERMAARMLAYGFLALTAIWAVLLTALGASLTSYLVSAAQLMLFAANTATLVTGTERRTLGIAAGVWISVLAFMAGAGQPAVIALFVLLTVMVGLAFQPAYRRGGNWRPGLKQSGSALGHSVIGAGQAVLFILVVLQQSGTVAPAATSAPLLLGIPLTELLLLQHQRRVASGRSQFADRAAFRLHLRQISWWTGVPLTLPVLIAFVLAWQADTPGGWALTASTLLAGINAICLFLVAHRRPYGAVLLVWIAAGLIAIGTLTLPMLVPGLTAVIAKTSAVVLFLVYLPALAEAVNAIKDSWSYR
jgi:hypothetical protein